MQQSEQPVIKTQILIKTKCPINGQFCPCHEYIVTRLCDYPKIAQEAEFRRPELFKPA